jgi:hypothetical protein
MASPSRVPLTGSITAAAVALFALLASPAARASLQDEIQVYLDDIDRPGVVGLELHVNTTPSGRSTPDYPGEVTPYHGLRVTPEFSWGLSRDWEAGLYLPFATDADGHAYAAGAKVRMKWMGLHADGPEGGTFAGANLELSRVQQKFDEAQSGAELRIMLGQRGKNWVLALNPVFEWDFGGPARSGTPDVSFGLKAGREVARGIMLGAEYYGELGRLNATLPSSQQDHRLFAAVDVDRSKVEFNFAVGYGLTSAADRWTVKAIVELPL